MYEISVFKGVLRDWNFSQFFSTVFQHTAESHCITATKMH